jgi:hypothetical protein
LGVALVLAAAVASYYYAGWSNLHYLTADPQTRQRLDAEELERSYRDAAKALEQQLRTALPKNAEIEAAIEDCNSVILNAKKKAVQIQKELSDEANSFLAKHSRGPINLEALHMENLIPDTESIKEIRVDSISDKPTSIRTDDGDLLQRYRADVKVTVSIRNRGGKDSTSHEIFIASATPAKQWRGFPSVAEVKERVLTSLHKARAKVQSATDSGLDQVKRDMQSEIHRMELQVLTESPR